jgi:hypothetical protein
MWHIFCKSIRVRRTPGDVSLPLLGRCYQTLASLEDAFTVAPPAADSLDYLLAVVA